MSEGTRVAAIDCGTNSIRLLVAEVAGAQQHEVYRQMRIVRLGEGVDRTGRLAPRALARTREALSEYARVIADTGATAVRMVATSATRDAANRDEFDAMVREVLGRPPEVISGREEAELSFAGAVAALDDHPGAPVLVVDIGGGSTELVLGHTAPIAVTAAHSMDVGSVRLTERHLRDDPPTGDQVAAAKTDITAALDRAGRDVPVRDAVAVIGVAGTVTTLAALAQHLPEYDRSRVDGYPLTAEQIEELTRELLSMTHDERAALPALHPGRVDVIAAGALVLRTVVRSAGTDTVIASEHDILDGIAAGLV